MLKENLAAYLNYPIDENNKTKAGFPQILEIFSDSDKMFNPPCRVKSMIVLTLTVSVRAPRQQQSQE